jgi:exodeoxyribonuclease VII small subunit
MSPRKRPVSAEASAAAAVPPPVGPDGRPLTFEQALERLETIVEQLEDGKLPLEQSIERFEEGVVLSRFLEGELGRAEKRVQELVDRAGAPGTRPWAEDDLAEAGEDDLIDDDGAL